MVADGRLVNAGASGCCLCRPAMRKPPVALLCSNGRSGACSGATTASRPAFSPTRSARCSPGTASLTGNRNSRHHRLSSPLDPALNSPARTHSPPIPDLALDPTRRTVMLGLGPPLSVERLRDAAEPRLTSQSRSRRPLAARGTDPGAQGAVSPWMDRQVRAQPRAARPTVRYRTPAPLRLRLHRPRHRPSDHRRANNRCLAQQPLSTRAPARPGSATAYRIPQMSRRSLPASRPMAVTHALPDSCPLPHT